MVKAEEIRDTHLIAYSCSSRKHESCLVTAVEEQMTTLWLRGSDQSGLKRMIYFRIVSLPQNGLLYEPMTNETLQTGDILLQTELYPYEHGVPIIYQGDVDFFTAPHVASSHYTESFKFDVISPLNGVLGVGSSSPVSKEIIVLNDNDRTVMNFPTEVHRVMKFSSLSWTANACLNTLANQTDHADNDVSLDALSRNFKLKINKLQIFDPDKNIDFVRVDVNTSLGGIISLNELYLNLTDFISCASRDKLLTTSWHCQGSGISNTKMTFLAKPNDLNLIFTGLMYEGFVEGMQPIYISIYDGEGGNCLSSDEHHTTRIRENIQGPPTTFTGCTVSTGKLLISVLAYNEGQLSNKSIPIPLQLMVALLAGFILLFIYACMGCCHREGILLRHFGNKTKRDLVSNQSDKELLVCDRLDLSKNEERLKQPRECSSNSTNKKEYMDGGEMRDTSCEEYEGGEETSKKSIGNSHINERPLDDTDKREPSQPNMSSHFEPNTISNANIDDNSQEQSNLAVGLEAGILKRSESETDQEEKFLVDEGNGAEWLQYFDSSSGDFYYENTMTREVTWTKPEHFLRVDDELDTT